MGLEEQAKYQMMFRQSVVKWLVCSFNEER
jgi:hypothetical protein